MLKFQIGLGNIHLKFWKLFEPYQDLKLLILGSAFICPCQWETVSSSPFLASSELVHSITRSCSQWSYFKISCKKLRLNFYRTAFTVKDNGSKLCLMLQSHPINMQLFLSKKKFTFTVSIFSAP